MEYQKPGRLLGLLFFAAGALDIVAAMVRRFEWFEKTFPEEFKAVVTLPVAFVLMLVGILLIWQTRAHSAKAVQPPAPVEEKPQIKIETHGAHSPAFATSGDHSPITFNAAPLRHTFELESADRLALVARLSTHTMGISIQSLLDDERGVPAADRFVALFKDAGWTVVSLQAVMRLSPPEKALLIHTPKANVEQAAFLSQCLTAAKLKPYVSVSDSHKMEQGATLNLVVYTKGAD